MVCGGGQDSRKTKDDLEMVSGGGQDKETSKEDLEMVWRRTRQGLKRTCGWCVEEDKARPVEDQKKTSKKYTEILTKPVNKTKRTMTITTI